MGPGQRTAHPSLLDRLDLRLATLATEQLTGIDVDRLIDRFAGIRAEQTSRQPTLGQRDAWIAGVLGIRGLQISPALVRAVLEDREGPHGTRQERVFVLGLDRALDRILARGAAGELPDGAFMVDLFRDVTQGLPRFTNNHLRRDVPWDALRHVRHPLPAALPALLDEFRAATCYRDQPLAWERAHPVRRAVRAMWRFARLAPFPDFNRMFAFVFCDAFLLAHGYPLLMPDAVDRVLLENVVGGGVPQRIVQFESRLLDSVQ